MSPAEELRAAAKVLRETASNATPGPRKVGRIAGIGHCVSSPDLKFCVAVEPGWVSKGDVAWIGLASPELAEPLADLLDDVAGLIDSHPDLARPHVDGEPCGDLACRIAHHALAVARAVHSGYVDGRPRAGQVRRVHIIRAARDLHAGDIVTHDPDHDRDVRWRVQAPPKLTAFGIAWFDYTDLADGSRGTAWFDALARLPVEPAAWLERAR